MGLTKTRTLLSNKFLNDFYYFLRMGKGVLASKLKTEEKVGNLFCFPLRNAPNVGINYAIPTVPGAVA